MINKRFFDNFCKCITPPLAAQNILWGEEVFFLASAQKKTSSPHKILSAAKPPFIHAKIVKEPNKRFILSVLSKRQSPFNK
jgi:hypothetical protein